MGNTQRGKDPYTLKREEIAALPPQTSLASCNAELKQALLREVDLTQQLDNLKHAANELKLVTEEKQKVNIVGNSLCGVNRSLPVWILSAR